MRTFFATLAVLSALAAPALAEPGDELAGNSAQAVNSVGARAAFYFNDDGTLRFVGGYEDRVFEEEGTYEVADGQLCFELPSFPSECLTYPEPAQFNKPMEMQSTEGYSATFVLIEGHAAVLPPAE